LLEKSFYPLTGFAIEGPSQAKIECEDQNDGSCDVKYWPSEAGEYAVHVMCDDDDIEDSPFMAYIIPDNQDINPSLVSDVTLPVSWGTPVVRYGGPSTEPWGTPVVRHYGGPSTEPWGTPVVLLLVSAAPVAYL
jgi:hypothetical protein